MEATTCNNNDVSFHEERVLNASMELFNLRQVARASNMKRMSGLSSPNFCPCFLSAAISGPTKLHCTMQASELSNTPPTTSSSWGHDYPVMHIAMHRQSQELLFSTVKGVYRKCYPVSSFHATLTTPDSFADVVYADTVQEAVHTMQVGDKTDRRYCAQKPTIAHRK